MKALTKPVLLLCVLLFLPGFGSGERLFAPGIEPWPKWQAHDPAAKGTIDHAAWDAFLARYLVVSGAGVNRVAYGAVSAPDRAALARYIDRLSTVGISAYARPEQMAYWINLYNALTISKVLAHYPVSSIRDIDTSPGLLAVGPWDEKLVTVEGTALSLNDIEHRILRPIWRDPRIHYAVNCASVGCPDLAPRAYTGAGIDAALDAAARAHVNDPRGVSIRNGRVTVSRIYDWFIEDFGGSEAGVLAHLKRYAEPELKAALERIDDLADTEYDWSLNDAG